MKKIEAIIRKTKFEDVKDALLEADIEWFSYYDVRGIGKSRQARIYRGVMYDTSSIERILISIVVRDKNAEKTVQAIIKSAQTGEIGDGRIFVIPIEDAIRIRTAERGDIALYNAESALVAFAGIDPTVRQSGEFNSTHNHMSKRGSPYLRHAIFLAATTCSFHNSPLNAYYKKKRDQGKHHLTATGAVARKLTTVIYAVLRDSKPYEPKKFC